MNAKRSLVALLAVLVLALGLGPAAVAASEEGGAAASAKQGKGKKKGKGKSCKRGKGKKKGKGKSCKRGKGKKNKGSKSATASAKKKGKKKRCGKGKGGSAGSKLANGRYADPKTELQFKVSGGGGKIQLEQIAFLRSCPATLAFGSGDSVPLKTRKGQAVAMQTFTVAGSAIATISWSVAIDPSSLRYSLEYTLGWEIPSSDPEVEPVRCDDRGKLSGRLER